MNRFYLLLCLIFCNSGLEASGQNDTNKSNLDHSLVIEFLGSGIFGSINGKAGIKLQSNCSFYLRIGIGFFPNLGIPNFSTSKNRTLISAPIITQFEIGNINSISLFYGIQYLSGFYGDPKRTTNQKTLETEYSKRDYLISIFNNIGVQYSRKISKRIKIGVGVTYLRYWFEINESKLGKYKYYPELSKFEKAEREKNAFLWPFLNIEIKLKKL